MGKYIMIPGADFKSVAINKVTPIVNMPVIEISKAGVVTITTDMGSSIHYTIDGSVPTKNSIKYTHPFNVENLTTVKAISIASDGTASGVSTRTYEIERYVYNSTYSNNTFTGAPERLGEISPSTKVIMTEEIEISKVFAANGVVKIKVDGYQSFNRGGIKVECGLFDDSSRIKPFKLHPYLSESPYVYLDLLGEDGTFEFEFSQNDIQRAKVLRVVLCNTESKSSITAKSVTSTTFMDDNQLSLIFGD